MQQWDPYRLMLRVSGIMPQAAIPPGPMMSMGMLPGWSPVPFRLGDMVVPAHVHMPEHAGRAARVVQVVWNQPCYAVDFGTGEPHRWYAHEELMPAPGTQPGQQVSTPRMSP